MDLPKFPSAANGDSNVNEADDQKQREEDKNNNDSPRETQDHDQPAEQNEAEKINKVPFWIRGLTYLILYELFCFMIYMLMADQFKWKAQIEVASKQSDEKELLVMKTIAEVGWYSKPISILYLLVVSLYTIGFGDVVPLTDAAKVVVCVLNFVSTALISLLISDLVDSPIEYLEKRLFKSEWWTEKNKNVARIVGATTVVAVAIIGGYIGTVKTNCTGHLDSFYLVMMGLLTIGFGDKKYILYGARLFAVCWYGIFVPFFERAVRFLAGRLKSCLHASEAAFWNKIHGLCCGIQQQQNGDAV